MSLAITKNNIFPEVAAFATANSLKVLWPNSEWDSDDKPQSNELWIEVMIDNTNTEQPCLGRPAGGAWERDEGLITIILYYPLGVSVIAGKSGTQLAEDFKTALQQKRFDKTDTATGSVVEAGRDLDLPFWRYNVFVPFRTDNLTGALS